MGTDFIRRPQCDAQEVQRLCVARLLLAFRDVRRHRRGGAQQLIPQTGRTTGDEIVRRLVDGEGQRARRIARFEEGPFRHAARCRHDIVPVSPLPNPFGRSYAPCAVSDQRSAVARVVCREGDQRSESPALFPA